MSARTQRTRRRKIEARRRPKRSPAILITDLRVTKEFVRQVHRYWNLKNEEFMRRVIPQTT